MSTNYLANIQDNDRATIMVLRLVWSSDTDSLRFDVTSSYFIRDKSLTKRDILSDIARLFDPVDLVGPVVVHAKLILRL